MDSPRALDVEKPAVLGEVLVQEVSVDGVGQVYGAFYSWVNRH